MSASKDKDVLFHPGHPRRLIPELCRHFYHQGWFTGTGGGISIKQGANIYVAPSAVQKERLEADDLFVLKADGSVSQSPAESKKLHLSQCTPLFMNAYKSKQSAFISSRLVTARLRNDYARVPFGPTDLMK
jgi:methylthioribulose-1-phosphate dehydratase